jgi:hypothetical protein
MSWHYQIAHRVDQNGDHWYSIREVYEGDGSVSFTESDLAPGGATRGELMLDMEMMLADAEMWPVLELDSD